MAELFGFSIKRTQKELGTSEKVLLVPLLMMVLLKLLVVVFLVRY